MKQSAISSIRIFEDYQFQRDGITSLNIWNYGDTDMIVTLDNIEHTVPKYDQDKKHARCFAIDPDFTYSTVTLSVDFVGGKGYAVLISKKLIENC